MASKATKPSLLQREGNRRRLIALLAFVSVTLLLAPTAAGDPFSLVDRQYLATLEHGQLCCPQSPLAPIVLGTQMFAVNTGKGIGNVMRRDPTYAQFSHQKDLLYELSRKMVDGVRYPLNPFKAGEAVVIAVHYYAGPAVECRLMKEMGGAMGEAPYWYGPVTYSGGLAVQPGCINVGS